MHAQRRDAQSIFLEAVEAHAPAGWQDFLDRACSNDAPLRRHVEDLLRAHCEYDSLFDGQALAPQLPRPESPEEPGTQIGPYTLREQIGEGGFGVVYVAEQSVPMRRKLALKVLKPGMDTQEIVARFESERQTLALMDHPNVARVLDAGATDSGRPYFVMELVKGLPITEFCDKSTLAPRQRLQLFVDVCRGVQHAHQKGIIHRDLKPSNVMVTLHDDKPVVKVIDFGVSKALSQKLTEKTIYTAYGQMIGTPLYMSPEQAQLSGLDVDTRSDVYSLGVLLYELLTGTTPFDKETLRKAGLDEIRRMIREEEPPCPSARVSTLEAKKLTTVCDQRTVDRRTFSRSLRGELDWIVMKAIEKDRNRRYESASAFAADIERYLNDQPVQACPPSVAYRCSKFLHRHRVLLLTLLAVVLALIAGMGVSVWQAFKANDARRSAERSRDLANERLLHEQAARREAAHQRHRAESNLRMSLEALDEVYLGILSEDVLREDGMIRSEADEQFFQTQQDSLETCLVFYERFINANEGNSFVRLESAKAYMRIGEIQRVLNRPDLASQAFVRAAALFEELAAADPGNAEYRYQLGLNLRKQHNEQAHQRSVEVLQELVDAYPDQPDYRHALGASYKVLGEYEASAAILEDLVDEFPESDPYLGSLGLCYAAMGQHTRAIDAYETLVSRNPTALEYRRTLNNIRYNFALKLAQAGKLQEARQLHLENLRSVDFLEDQEYSERICLAARGQNQCALSKILKEMGNTDKATEHLRQAIVCYETLVAVRGNNAWSWLILGDCYDQLQETSQAIKAYSKAAELYEARVAFLPTAWNWAKVGAANERLGNLLLETGRNHEALSAYSKAAESYQQREQEAPTWLTGRIAWLLNREAQLLPASGTLETADAVRAMALSQEAVEKPSGNPDFLSTLGMARYRIAEHAGASEALHQSIKMRGTDFFYLAMAHWQLGHRDEARQWYEKAVAWMQKNRPNDRELNQWQAEAEHLLEVKIAPRDQSSEATSVSY